MLPHGSFREELGKIVCWSAYPEPGYSVADLYSAAQPAQSEYHITKSIAAIDVTPVGVDKAFGLRELLRRHRLSSGEALAIGDSWNDLPLLDAAGLSACPSNAVPEVKEVVDYVSPLPSTRGVIDILHWAKRKSADGSSAN